MSVAACGGGPTTSPADFDPFLQLEPTGTGRWTSHRDDQLGSVSNNGLGYTGEIDHFAIHVPEPGRLQVSLAWHHDADFDLILAADEFGQQRLAEGAENGFQPEYVGIPVAGGQTVHVFVAGWNGDPGAYELESILLPYDAPVFALDETPDFSDLWPANRPLSFLFTVPLDPGQVVGDAVAFVGQGHAVEGQWCIDGKRLTFYPALPGSPGEAGGLDIGLPHTIQFPRGARGLRAETGEYLDVLATGELIAGGYEDSAPGEPPRVVAVSPEPGERFNAAEILLDFSEALDPATLDMLLLEVEPSGLERVIAFHYLLAQGGACGDGAEGPAGISVRLAVAAAEPLRAGMTLRLRVFGTTLGITGRDEPANGVTGPAPAPGGQGYAVDFTLP